MHSVRGLFFRSNTIAEGQRFRVARGHEEQRPTLDEGVGKERAAGRFVLYVVPKYRSPKSPSPGRMNFRSFRARSTTAV